MTDKNLSIIVPTYGHIEYTKECLENLRRVAPNAEKIFIDDGSTDGTVEYLSKQKDIIFVDNKTNKGVTYSWNLGVSMATKDYICVINNDVVFPEGFFEKLMQGLEEPDVLFSVPRWTNGRKGEENMLIRYYKNHLCGFVYMIKKNNLRKIFPLEPRLRIFGSDNWAYHKTKELGYYINTVADAVCHHYESITSKSEPNLDTELFFEIAKEEGWNIVDTIYGDDDATGYILI